MVAPFSKFTAKYGLVFILTLENAFSQRFHFQATERAQVILKNGTRNFQNSPSFERSACFYVTISENFEHFHYFNFETDFLENENFFKKLQYRFLVERTKIEKASLPYKTAISKANIKANRMVATEWAYHREWSFTSNYFIFLKALFQFKNLL